MRNWYSKVFAALLLLHIPMLLQACSDDSEAAPPSSGLTEVEVNALIKEALAPLKQEIAALQADIQALRDNMPLVVSSSQESTGMSQKAEDPEAIGCNFPAFAPANRLEATTILCQTSLGYLFNLDWPDGGPPQVAAVYYTQAECMGTPYVPTFVVEDGARKQGVILSYIDGVGTHVGMVVANTPVTAHTIASVHNGSTCYNVTGNRTDLIEVVLHLVDTGTDSSDPNEGIVGANDITGGKNNYPAMSVQ